MNYGMPFKLGLVLYGSFPEVLNDTDILFKRLVEVSKDLSFDIVELPVVEERNCWPRIRKIIVDAAVDVVASAGPSCVLKEWNLSSTNEAERITAVEGMKEAIDFAYAVGSRELAFLSGKDPGEDQGRKKARKSLLSSVESLLGYARKNATDYVLVLSLEPADRKFTHMQLIGPTREAADLLREVRQISDAINITLDMSHIAQLGETLEQATSNLRGRVSHAHIANALIKDPTRPEYGDQHPRFGLPGSEYDEAEITRYMELLIKKCFSKASVMPYGKPVVSLEVKPGKRVDPKVSLAGAKRSFFKAYSQMFSNKAWDKNLQIL